MPWREGCSGRWQRSRAACPRAGRQQDLHGRQLLAAAAARDHATKDKFMGPRAALWAEHTAALWS